MNLNPFLDVILSALSLYNWGLVIFIIINMLLYFEIINKGNLFVIKIYVALSKLYEPVLNRIRRYLPNLGTLDISPIIVFLAIQLLEGIIVTYFYY